MREESSDTFCFWSLEEKVKIMFLVVVEVRRIFDISKVLLFRFEYYFVLR